MRPKVILSGLRGRILLGTALLTPLMPKYEFAENVFLYPLEVALIVYLLLAFDSYRPYLSFNLQKNLFLLSAFLLLFSIVSQYEYSDIGAILRSIKLIIYIPLIYIAHQAGSILLRPMLLIGIFAMVLNLVYYAGVLYPIYGFDIWTPEALPSGFSNRYITSSFSDFLLTPGGGAHGIWGGYYLLIFTIGIYLKRRHEISAIYFSITTLLVLLSLILSVSRDTAMSFVIYFLMLLLSCDTRSIGVKGVFSVIALIFLVYLGIGFYGLDLNIGLIEKVLYTADSIQSAGTEGNVQARLNGWILTSFATLSNPLNLLIGLGFNRVAYTTFFENAASTLNFQSVFATVPESLLLFGFVGGGLIGLFLIANIFRHFIMLSLRCRKSNSLWILGAYLLAIIPANVLSGAPLIADLLYGQTLLFVGILLRLTNSELVTQRSVLSAHDIPNHHERH